MLEAGLAGEIEDFRLFGGGDIQNGVTGVLIKGAFEAFNSPRVRNLESMKLLFGLSKFGFCNSFEYGNQVILAPNGFLKLSGGFVLWSIENLLLFIKYDRTGYICTFVQNIKFNEIDMSNPVKLFCHKLE